MREITPEIVLALTQHLLGWTFWPAGAFAALCLLNLVWLVASDGRIARAELFFSILTGIGGGSIAAWAMLALTRSTMADMAGFVDWILLAGIWLAGMLGTTATVYAIVRPLRLAVRAGASCPGAAPRYMAPNQPLRFFLAAIVLIAAGAFAYQTFPLVQAGHRLADGTDTPRAAEAPAWLGHANDPQWAQHESNGVSQ